MNKINWKKPITEDKEVIELWDNISIQYDAEKYWSNNDAKANLIYLKNKFGSDFRNSKVLEMGCGSGLVSLELAKNGAQVSLLDISENVLNIAENYFNKNSQVIINKYPENALNNTVENNLFDLTWNAGVLEHFSNDDICKFISEMYRVTKPGGKIIILVPNKLCFPFQIMQFYLKITNKWRYGYENDISPFRLRKLIKKLEYKNFEIFAYNVVSGFFWVPYMKQILNFFGFDKLKYHCKKNIFGAVTIAIIKKDDLVN
jgi:ubiquinone/menaquinone biosynthesis C-methylase UbiE